MKKIYLSGKHKDKYAIVDDEDFIYLNQYKWRWTKEYAVRDGIYNNKCVLIPMHREILGLKTGDPRIGDHKNHNTLDNRKENLRICTLSNNSCNRRPNGNKTHPYKGLVYCPKYKRKWRVIVRIKKIVIDGGRFEDIILAAKRHDQLVRVYHGEFACLNFPEVINYSDVDQYLKQNQPKEKNDLSLPKGITINRGKYLVRVCSNGKRFNIGKFDTKERAIESKIAAEIKLKNG